MKLKYAIFLIVMIANACKEPFSPEVDSENRDLLVVEGHLTIEGISTFTLSRSGDLQEIEARKPETNARVLIEEGDNVVAEGTSGQNGICSISTDELELSKKYRVRIIRASGKVYETDYLENKAAPEIDEVNSQPEGKGFMLYLNTHDPSSSTKFYSWNYKETWEIRSPVISFWEVNSSGKIVPRDQTINITRCWQESASSNIMLGSSERLSEDRISGFPLTFVSGNSIKLGHMYSILVKQFALTREGYQYLEAMKKNTEDIGTIFDPQPTELLGNIKCVTNPKEEVIGWISSGSVSEKRIFINQLDKPAGWGEYRDEIFCDLKEKAKEKVMEAYVRDSLIVGKGIYLLESPPNPPGSIDTSYTMTRRICVDCRLRGSNIKPLYWPN